MTAKKSVSRKEPERAPRKKAAPAKVAEAPRTTSEQEMLAAIRRMFGPTVQIERVGDGEFIAAIPGGGGGAGHHGVGSGVGSGEHRAAQAAMNSTARRMLDNMPDEVKQASRAAGPVEQALHDQWLACMDLYNEASELVEPLMKVLAHDPRTPVPGVSGANEAPADCALEGDIRERTKKIHATTELLRSTRMAIRI